MVHKAQRDPKRVVFPEGEESKILRACQIILDEKIARPILLGDEARIRATAEALRLHLNGAVIVDPPRFARLREYVEELYRLRHRKGVTRSEAEELVLNKNVFGSLMVRMGDADALIGGLTQHYPDTIRPALQVLAVRPGLRRVAGLYVLITPKGDLYFLADTTVNIEPTAEDLAEIAMLTAETARRFDVEPRVAMLSFSNFGSTRHPLAEKVRRAVELLHERMPELMVDGEMQADTAVVPEIIEQTYPFSVLRGGANVLIFPDLEAGNIAYKLLMRIGGAEAIGPILMGLSRPVHVLQRGCEVSDIVNMTAIAVVDAQEYVGGPQPARAEAPQPVAT
ncbi:MAG: phosphate acyltransferase [Bryobacteraceae bacterium]|nr:phosphate acyltransferase [Bryobacteraceae bacterium]